MPSTQSLSQKPQIGILPRAFKPNVVSRQFLYLI